MLSNYLIAPSLNSLFFTGMLLLWIIFLFLFNLPNIITLNYYKQLLLLSALTVAFGIHGLLHMGAETTYNFNPYKWF